MKKLLALISITFVLACLIVPISGNNTRIIDEANVLSSQEEQQLNDLVENYIKTTNYDIIVYFTSGSSYYDTYGMDSAITKLADDYFDYNGYGIGTQKEGLILCVDLYYRDYTITTHGNNCIRTYSDSSLNNIYDAVTPYLSSGNYFSAAKTFINKALNIYKQANTVKNPIVEALVPASIGAIIITLIVFIILRMQLKSVAKKASADNYMHNTNVSLFRSGDVYLYTNVSRRRIERNDNHSGSSTHISSSGQHHGGGGSHRF